MFNYEIHGMGNGIEALAGDQGLAYVALGENLNAQGKGFGLALGTMDVFYPFGAEASYFLDMGQDMGKGPSKEKIIEAFKWILSGEGLRGVFVNTLGGRTKCDVIAEGIVAAVKATQTEIPVVVRLEGKNREQGQRIFEKSRLNIVGVKTLAEGAQQVISFIA